MKIGPWEVDPLWIVVAGAAWTGAAVGSIEDERFSLAGEIVAVICVLIIAACVFIISKRHKTR